MDGVHFGLGDAVDVDAGDASALAMHTEHDFFGFGALFCEYIAENHDDEVHGGVVVVVEKHFIFPGAFDVGAVLEAGSCATAWFFDVICQNAGSYCCSWVWGVYSNCPGYIHG